MKRIFTLGAMLLGATAFAQTENVGIGTVQPDKSAILDLSSSNKGFLLPRMSETQRTNIAKPATGLQVYQTDGTAGVYVYNGKDWENASKSVAGATDPWLRGGNAILPGEFLGTTNPEPLVFRVNNIPTIRLDLLSNSFFGNSAGNSTTTGQHNLGLGTSALSTITTGSYNIAAGIGSQGTVTQGVENVAIGTYSLYSNNIGTDNIAIGSRALFASKSSFNVAIGSNSLTSNTTGNYNFGIGGNSLNKNISGADNFAIGIGALENLISGNKNLALGTYAGRNATGSRNIFIGYQAGQNETSNDKLYIANSPTTTPLIYGDFAAKFVTIGDVPESLAKRDNAVTSGGYNLLVKGGILTEKVKVALVTTGDWADYVFEPTYKEKMMTLEEVEKYTIRNKHLPKVPSAQEMVEKGMEVGQTSKMFMEKIEELTLYIIELNKRIKELENKK